MGIIIQEKDAEKKKEECKLLIANHITPFDHLAISLVYPCLSVNVYNLPGPISTILCCRNFGSSQGRDSLRSNIHAYLNKPNSLPVLLHPEGGTTSGHVALMKFSSWPFDIEKSVLALGLTVQRVPILDIAPSVLRGSWTADLFFLLFSPVTVFSIKYVGKYTRAESESAQDFAARVQKATASALSLEASNHTNADKIELVKRLAREEAAAANPFLSPEVHSMALQVREVLPYLSLDAIKRDLVRTRNVDLTITNFLESNAFEAALSPSASPSAVSRPVLAADASAQSSRAFCEGGVAPHDLNMSAKSFGKSATERMQSFEERKRILIDKARRRYLQKQEEAKALKQKQEKAEASDC